MRECEETGDAIVNKVLARLVENTGRQGSQQPASQAGGECLARTPGYWRPDISLPANTGRGGQLRYISGAGELLSGYFGL